MGPPDCSTAADFYSIGSIAGFVTVGFDQSILDGPGDDVILQLTGFGPNQWQVEDFYFSASNDGVNFAVLGYRNPNDYYPEPLEVVQLGFDLAVGGLTEARYVKVENAAPNPNTNSEGPDICGFEALNFQGFCGDSNVDDGEECDEGTGNSDDPGASCRTDCTFARCGDGITDPGEQCDDGNNDPADVPDDHCEADCILPPELIPTVSEWGLIITGLMLLVLGTLALVRVRAVAGAGRDTAAAMMADQPPVFLPELFFTVSLAVIGLVFAGLALAWWITGELSSVDLFGSLISAPILAYLLHLWIAAKRQ